MNKIDKILKLAGKTGDKIIITNPDGSEAFVIMSFSEYKRVVEGQQDVRDLSEEELWSQINRDINLWKERHENSEAFFCENNFEQQNELQNFDPCFDQESFDFDEEKNNFLDNELDIEPTFFNNEEVNVDFENNYMDKKQNSKLEQDLNWQQNNLVEDKENKTRGAIVKNEFVGMNDNSKEKLDNNKKKKKIKKKSRFAIPQERLVHADESLMNSDMLNEKSSVSYEDIQDEAEINVEDLMNNQSAEKVIDMSFSEEDIPEDL